MLKKFDLFISMGIYYKKQLIQHPNLLKNRIENLRGKIKLKLAPRYSFKHWYNRAKKKMNPQKKSIGNQTCLIYVIYAQDGKLHRYKQYFLDQIVRSFDQIFIVVNGQLQDEEIKILKRYGIVYVRRNVGYDVAAFKYALEKISFNILATYETLFLVNDTLIGPLFPIQPMLDTMKQRRVDFWGIAYGEKQWDFTKKNIYGYIPVHLQTYFLAINHTLLKDPCFEEYWNTLMKTTTRNEAIAFHETRFTKYFEDRGFRSSSYSRCSEDTAMFKHPLILVKKDNVPFIKTTAIKQMSELYLKWMGEKQDFRFKKLVEFVNHSTNYPVKLIDEVYRTSFLDKKHIVIIDGTNDSIPQLNRYRVQNKKEQLETLGYKVIVNSLMECNIESCVNCFIIIIYRAIKTPFLEELCDRAKIMGVPVLYELDDLIIDTEYTNQLSYVQSLSLFEKSKYDKTVSSYRSMLLLTDGIIVSTKKLKETMQSFQKPVFINRNLASHDLIVTSESVLSGKEHPREIILGYFSGSITHNENFLLIVDSLVELFESYSEIKLVIVGYLDIPEQLNNYRDRIEIHDFVPWQKLPEFIKGIDINLAPLVETIFNECKSEIKWIEASLLKVATVASDIGAFREMIQSGETGILVQKDWTTQLKKLIDFPEYRKKIGQAAYQYVKNECQTTRHEDELTRFIAREFKR